jgi:hypothetical protein
MRSGFQAEDAGTAGQERAAGWYWVRYTNTPEIGFWDGSAWFVIGSELAAADAAVPVISARLEPPA